MELLPAIDLKEGRCVRLEQGRADRATDYGGDPTAVAVRFGAAGARWIHVVDLDGAFAGEPHNLEVLRRIAAAAPGVRIEFGGGLRTLAAVAAARAAGAHRVVLGTRAAADAAFVAEVVREVGPEGLAVGVDARDGQVLVRGWVEGSGRTVADLAGELAGVGVRTLIHTDVATDGMLSGPNLGALESLLKVWAGEVIASGGVGSLADLTRVAALSRREPRLTGVIVGKAIYEGRVGVSDALRVLAALTEAGADAPPAG